MEANKDAALRCLDIARTHLASGNYADAAKYANKSISLYPSPAAEKLLETIGKQTSSSSTSSPPPYSSSPASTRAGTPSSSSSSSSKSAQQTSAAEGKPGLQNRNYTKEQLEAVKKVKSCGSNYYEILQVEKTATENDIKKSYRRMALQFHPDKNSAPGADEAFKLISKAFTILSDEDKRAHYDRYGSDPDSRGGGGGMRARGFAGNSAFFRGEEADEISPEQLFNMFFGGMDLGGGRGFHSATFVGPGLRNRRFHRPRHQHHAEQQQTQNSSLYQFFQFLPLIFLFLISITSSLFSSDSSSGFHSSDPSFSLQRSHTYSTERYTHQRGIPYYVDMRSFQSFLDEPQARVQGFEQRVETYYLRRLQQLCSQESELRRQKLIEANKGWFFRDLRKIREAENMPLPSCDLLRRYGQRA